MFKNYLFRIYVGIDIFFINNDVLWYWIVLNYSEIMVLE